MKHDAHTEARAIGKTARRTAIAVAVLTLAMLTLAAAIVFAALRSDADIFAPLGPYPVQHVGLPVEDGLPTLHVSDDPLVVPVSGRKCVDGSGISVTGEVSWQSVNPPGTVIRTGTGARETRDGCQTFQYVNVVPRTVRFAMETQLRAGIQRPEWRITGVETPTRDGVEGSTLSWITETFAVAP